MHWKSLLRQAAPALVIGVLTLGMSFAPLGSLLPSSVPIPDVAYAGDPQPTATSTPTATRTSTATATATQTATATTTRTPTVTRTPNPSLGTLYGTNPSLALLLEIDRNTGAGVPKANAIWKDRIPAIAVDPATGTLYAAGSQLYTVDPSSGSGTPVGSFGVTYRVTALDFHPNGTLYAAVRLSEGAGGTQLGTIDKKTGGLTLIGPFGAGGFEALSFAPDGTLYAARRQSVAFVAGAGGNARGGVSGSGAGTGLYTVNTSTGAATLVAQLLLDGKVSIGLLALQFDCKGTLYGGTASIGIITGPGDSATGQGGGVGGRLVTIDPVTGFTTLVGTGIASTGSLGSLATRNNCTPPSPTPTVTATPTATSTRTNTPVPTSTREVGRRTTPTRIGDPTQPPSPTRGAPPRTTPTAGTAGGGAAADSLRTDNRSSGGLR